MCFSPESSFAGGIIIFSIGIATVRKVHKRSQLVFASIPLFFGIQQFAEGLLWLTIPHPECGNIQKNWDYNIFNNGSSSLANHDSPFSYVNGREQEKEKDIAGFAGNGHIIIFLLCLLFNIL